MKLFARALVVVVCLLAAPASAQDIQQKFDKGMQAYGLGDFATALREWRPLAEAGSVLAAHNLGSLYENGQGVPQDFIEAAIWYRKAAEQGYAAAQTNLGSLYWYGRGVPQDYAEAEKWYRRAVEQGDAQAQFNLGLMYHNGVEVPQDLAEAVTWWRKAAAQGHDAAKRRLSRIHELPQPEDKVSPPNPPGENAQTAGSFTDGSPEQAFEQGLSAARSESYASAYQIWLPLAENGHIAAQFYIGALHEGGLGTEKSEVAAATWYFQAAYNGHAQAQYNLAMMYLEGRGVNRDETRAVDLLRRASRQKHAKAQYNLAVLYQSGRGVKKDIKLARSWFDRARLSGVTITESATASEERDSSARNSAVSASDSWRTVCENGICRTYVTSKYPYDQPDYQKYYLPVLEVTSSNEILFSGLYARGLHNQIYTTDVPTELIHDEEEYVATTYFSAKRNIEYALFVDGRQYAMLKQIDTGHLGVAVTKPILAAFRRGTLVEIRPSINGYFAYKFSLKGFSSAYGGRRKMQQARRP